MTELGVAVAAFNAAVALVWKIMQSHDFDELARAYEATAQKASGAMGAQFYVVGEW